MSWDCETAESRHERHQRLRLLAMKIAVLLPVNEVEAMRTLEYVRDMVRFVNEQPPGPCRAGVVLPLVRPLSEDPG
jgi:hypothetical protein